MDLENLLPESFKQDEKEYWQMREKLLEEYRGKWVAFHQKEILSSGNNLYQVTLEAFQKSKKGAFITKVGEEDKIVTKIRLRKEFDYDMEYEPFPLPQARVKFYNFEKTMSKTYQRVIPDTGTDTTCLPTEDCQSLRLFSTPGIRARSRSFGGPYRDSIFTSGFC